VAARLLVAHQHILNRKRIQVVVLPVHEPRRLGLHQPGDEALAQKAALAVAVVGVEPVAHDRPAAADNVGDYGHRRAVHLREVDIGVADLGADRDRLLPHLDNLHGSSNRPAGLAGWALRGEA
jgi:hypothetical protein